MKNYRPLFTFTAFLALVAMACQILTNAPGEVASTATVPPPTPAATATALPPRPVQPGEANPDEPVFITGDIPYTSPFFVRSLAEPYVLLEDQAGFVRRDREFEFNRSGQVIGPVEVHEDMSLTYSLSLPSIPQGTQIDLDNDGQTEPGVQVFAVAYWSNTWGDPFLEERDGTGWSTAYASTITDAENEDEIKGGILVVWSPDDEQGFPTGFGEDGKLFTEDDPAGPIPAGYSIVDLNQEPFEGSKQPRPEITLNEGESAVNDFSDLSYSEAFEAMFQKVSREYPFTVEKKLDWEALHDEYAARVGQAGDATEFYRAIRDFLYSIPDGHVGFQPDSFNSDVFFEESGGGFGLALAELSDGRVIVTHVLPDTAGAQAGIEVGAEILTWQGEPVSEALGKVKPVFGPHSTVHALRLNQVLLLTHVTPGARVEITYRNPGSSETQETRLNSEIEVESLFANSPGSDPLELPVEGEELDDTGFGYIRIPSFNDDDNLSARLWERYVQNLIENNVPGLIIDIRENGGGNPHLALDFAGYFFDEEIILYRDLYYSDETGKFEYSGLPEKIEPGPALYEGPIAVLIGPNCASACEIFAYALQAGGRSTLVGHYPTAGLAGEVGRGQYTLPENLSFQIPTGRGETPEGEVFIEGVGVLPDVTVPVTEASALGRADTVLEAAIKTLQEKAQ